MEHKRIGIKSLEEEFASLKNKKFEILSAIEQLENYVGGDLTGTEYVRAMEMHDLCARLNQVENEMDERLRKMCTLKIKFIHAVLCGANANENLFKDEDGVFSFVKGEIFDYLKKNTNFSLEQLNFVLDGGKNDSIFIDKKHKCICFNGKSVSGEDCKYQINLYAKGVELAEIKNENEKNA